MKKKLIIIALAAIIILGGGVAYWYYHRPAAVVPVATNNNENQAAPLVGNDRDAHGCIGSAGYTWCEVKQKCLRSWEEPCTVATSTTIITYFCQEGILKAEYGQNKVTLTLKNNQSLDLPQVISGSGIRYEAAKNVFISKGDNANLTENDKVTYTNCVAGTQALDQDLNTYANSEKTFSFSYPNEFSLSGGNIGFSQDWNAQTNYLGTLLAVVNIPKDYLPQTNFGDSKFTVGVSADPEAIKNCLSATSGNNIGTTSVVSIAEQNFTKINFADAGAGNFYETTSYRTIKDNMCYALEYTIHSLNIGNYSPDQGIKEFDKAKITALFEALVQSFRFN